MDKGRIRRAPRAAGPIGMALRAYLLVRTIGWFFTRPATGGVRAIAVTPEGRVVLVRHSYLRGWHLPGGGQNAKETPHDALLRELREEIGMIGHGDVRLLGTLRHQPNFRRDTVTLAVVESVRYAFRPSLEIIDASAFDPRALPADTGPATRRRIEDWLADRRPPADW
ncbi:NUDIX domain-containing protein [Sphingomonas sp. RS6]